MRRRRAPSEGLSHEFELDLAPLLAVMVKLVPVLIASSAFVPVVIIQTELPAAIAAAISEQKTEEPKRIELVVNPTSGMDLRLVQGNKNLEQAHMDYPKNLTELSELKQNLVKFKKQVPQLFRLELIPQGDIPYEVVIKIIDAARKSPKSENKFQFRNPATDSMEETDYMFPDVVFANILEG